MYNLDISTNVLLNWLLLKLQICNKYHFNSLEAEKEREVDGEHTLSVGRLSPPDAEPIQKDCACESSSLRAHFYQFAIFCLQNLTRLSRLGETVTKSCAAHTIDKSM